jgi:hypothetical protein
MRLPKVRFTVGRLLVAIAVLAALFGGLRLWQRAEFYRRQAAICALYEDLFTWYAIELGNHPDSTIEERQEDERGNRLEANRYGTLKVIYARVATHPWEFLPPETPGSVNPWDFGDLSTSEIEEEVKARLDEMAGDERVHLWNIFGGLDTPGTWQR